MSQIHSGPDQYFQNRIPQYDNANYRARRDDYLRRHPQWAQMTPAELKRMRETLKRTGGSLPGYQVAPVDGWNNGRPDYGYSRIPGHV